MGKADKKRGCLYWPLRLTLAAAMIFTAFQVLTWPDVARLAAENPDTTAFIERYRLETVRDGKPPGLQREWAVYADISPHLKKAVIVSEDAGFFSHRGFAWDEVENAVRDAARSGRAPRGASTITQQLAKNLWLSPSRSPLRKLKEAVLTWQLERYLEKRRILELYLNVVEFGPGVYGAGAAARHYFGKSAAKLNAEEAAGLAAGLPKPSVWHPGSTSEIYRRHVQTILGRMAGAGHLDELVQ